MKAEINNRPLAFECWYDINTNAADPAVIACLAFSEYGLIFDENLQTPRFYDFIGFDAISAFFQLSKTAVKHLIDGCSYTSEQQTYEEVISRIDYIIAQITQINKDTNETKEP